MSQDSVKVVVVTGNSRGLGAAIQQELEGRGYVVWGTHNDPNPQLRVDVRNEWGIKRMFEEASEKGKLFGLVNNAGVLDHEPFGELSQLAFDLVMRTNVLGPLLCCQEAVKYGVESVVNVGSNLGVTGAYGKKPVYAASKAALHSLTRTLSRSLAPIRVNAIAAGIVDTGIHQDQTKLNQPAVLKRHGVPREISKVCADLLESTYTTGAVWHVDGGR